MKTDLTPVAAPSIRSRPVYSSLEPRPGAVHIIVADDEGAVAVEELVAKVNDRSAMLAATHVMYCPGPTGTDLSARLEALGAAQFFRAPTVSTLLPRLQRVVADAHMGAQFYLAGTEGLIGQAEREIMATGFPHASIQKEHRGSTLRRVQCVHCKGITENVATDPFRCSHCGLNLFVRDHYSRRLAAFQGVNIDAEDPGQVPEPVVRFEMSGGAKLKVHVTEIVPVNELVTRFRFEARDGSDLPAFSGGAHTVVEMDDHGTRRLNPYSLMSDPADRSGYEISVRRDDVGRGGSLYMHRHVRVGMEMTLSYPVNLFPLDSRAKKHLMIAGGIGITPFLAQIAQIQAFGGRFELHYAARSRSLGAYMDRLTGAHPAQVHCYFDEEGQTIDLNRVLAMQPIGTHLYVCGPKGMIKWVLATAEGMGWPKLALHSEEFIAPGTGLPFQVQLAASGLAVTVGPTQSLLEAMEAAGVDAPYLCRGGACGQCETKVHQCDGTILHRDHWLTPEEQALNTKIMPCVSRFEGRTLVIDR